MLTAIASHRWLIGHGLRLVVLKCTESPEIRQAFVDVVSTWLAKGMSEGLQYGIKHGKASRDLGDVEIRDLRLSSSQLKIPIYPEVCDPKDPWAVKEEISLEDAIAVNIGRAKKKNKCRVGLAIFLTNAATQTEGSEGEVSLRLIRSKSLPPMFNSEWP
ncbi:hypothetical protein Tco_0002745 [Tanacetum coccineum]